jgi:hypothetical protein
MTIKLIDAELAYHLHGCPIQSFRLQKDNRVRVADASQQQSLGSSGAAWNHHLQARRVRKVRLGRLRVVVRAVSHSAVWSAEGQAAHVELPAAAVAVFGCLVDNLARTR